MITGEILSYLVELQKEFRFEAAHFLSKVPDTHKCKRLHGHSYRIVLSVKGNIEESTGWLIDLGDIEQAFHPVRESLDHRCLNDIPGLENPTSENLAVWILTRVQPTLQHLLHSVTVYETATSSCTVFAKR